MLLVRLWPGFHSQDLAFIHYQLPVVANGELQPIQRPRRRPFEIESRLIEAAAVAWALEFIFRRKPARSASEMRALGKNRVDAFFLAHDPDALLLFVFLAHLSHRVIGRPAGLEGRRRLEENSRKRGAKEAEQAEKPEDAETAPPQTREEIPPRPDASFYLRRFLFVRHSF